jgi:hypothetical protein
MEEPMNHRHAVLPGAVLVLALMLAAPARAQDAASPTVGEREGRLLLKRGDDYLPAPTGTRLLEGDELVLLQDSRVDVLCDDQVVATFSEFGTFPVPECPIRVAGAPPAAPPVAQPTAPAPTAPRPAGGGFPTTGVLIGVGVVGALAAAGGGGGGGGGGSQPPVSP